jgi:hypothetical protein
MADFLGGAMRFLVGSLLIAATATPAFGVTWTCGLITVDTDTDTASFEESPLPLTDASSSSLASGEDFFIARATGPLDWDDTYHSNLVQLVIQYEPTRGRYEAEIHRLDLDQGVFESLAYLDFVCVDPASL